MKISISQNISKLRREHDMTQEQLAEALGVSFAAVSKWERGVATPELNTIVEMADLFSVSVDALLGYEMRSNDRASVVQRLRDYVHDRGNGEAISEAEKALQRFPNSFDVVYRSAVLYSVYGLDELNDGYTRRALALFQHACRLIDQNTDPTISETSIQRELAIAYLSLGDEKEKGLEILKKHNPCGVNNALIGMRLAANCDRPDEALPYLSEAMLDLTMAHMHITTGYLNAYIKKKNFAEADALLEWALAFYPGLKREDATCHLEKSEAILWAIRAAVQLDLHQPEKASDSLRRAKAVALHFDSAPNYDASSLRFVELGRAATSHDDLGATAMDAVEAVVIEMEVNGLRELWEAIKHEK